MEPDRSSPEARGGSASRKRAASRLPKRQPIASKVLGRTLMSSLDLASVCTRGRAAFLGAFAAAAMLASPALAEYPERDITMVIPFGVGGGSDVLARTIGNVIQERNLPP